MSNSRSFVKSSNERAAHPVAVPEIGFAPGGE
jgi:hypothetical protein